jgi:hypothetical protein
MGQAVDSKTIEPRIALGVIADQVGPGGENSLEDQTGKDEQKKEDAE